MRLRSGVTGASVIALVAVITVGGVGAIAAPHITSRSATADGVPTGWVVAGTRPQDYVMLVDHTVMRAGKPSAKIEGTASQPGGFGTLMQQISADAYRGQRIRLSGELRVRDVKEWAALWMRVDGPHGEVLSFDNAQERAAHGTSEWLHFDVVLDVPTSADGIAFGALLAGSGTAWVNGLTFEAVPVTVPLTGRNMGGTRAPSAPVNLDFTLPQ